jgi:hypothetical protein
MSPEILQTLQTGGAIGVLAIVVWLLLTGKLVPGRAYIEMRDRLDRDIAFWRDRTDVALKASERTITVAEDLMSHLRRGP